MANSLVYKGFKDLDCWKKGRELRMKIFVLTKQFPVEEKYMLTSQIIRSSRSVTNNIAEGYGRYTYTDTRHYFIQARGSVTETIDHLSIAFHDKHIDAIQLKELETLCETVFKLINGYISYLDRQKTTLTQILIPDSK
jgi:four helix bundle protein